VVLSNGSKDLYIRQERFPAQFAADVPAREAALMAVAQRPVTEEALNEKSAAAAWTSVPAWFIWGDQDRNIPPAAQAFMAERAHARRCDVVKGASHVVMVSHPDRVVRLIETAASSK
jgi:pimeloyl-ACP methyl ester carboxylesterase